jgi:hypothetical protein
MRGARFLLLAGWLATTGLAGEPSDPVAALKRFSDFQQLDLTRLLAGEIATERGALMDFPNGISAQACFVMAGPPAEAARRLRVWDPSPHEALKVYSFHPLPVPCTAKDFQALNFQTNSKPIRWLFDKTVATTPTKSDLNLTRAEAAALAGGIQKQSDARVAADCWSKLLAARAAAFQQKGVAGMVPYEMAGAMMAPAVQLRTMLREEAGVGLEFVPILRKIGLFGNAPDAALPAFYYWSLFDADHHAVLNLGAVYQLAVGEHYQLADIEYYESAELYTAIALYEIWPIQIGGQPGALVWRGDYVTAPMLAFTKGTERLAYGVLMVQEIKKEIRCLLDEAKSRR